MWFGNGNQIQNGGGAGPPDAPEGLPAVVAAAAPAIAAEGAAGPPVAVDGLAEAAGAAAAAISNPQKVEGKETKEPFYEKPCQATFDAIYADLYAEVRCAAPMANISYSLRGRIERCEPAVRAKLCNKVGRDRCSPIFLACKKGNCEIVDYLIRVCHADIEKRGTYVVPDDQSEHFVTPLWCAAVAGRYKVVEMLIRFGADVNTVSDTGSTPVRSACFMTHLDIVRLLVRNRADIQRPNYNGGTCLVNSVQSVELCDFLLRSGANVNAQDIQNKTALHYAIQEHRFETTKLLLRYGANPFLETRHKDDALQTACLKGAAEIFEYLIDHIPYTPERVASAFELLGATFLDEHHDSQKTLKYWKAACDIRKKFGVTKQIDTFGSEEEKTEETEKDQTASPERKKPRDEDLHQPKRPRSKTRAHYKDMYEFKNRIDLDNLSLDLDAIRIQALLIYERILGWGHKDMIYRLMLRGGAYCDSLQYQNCIDLWKYALEIRVAKETILYCDTFVFAHALVNLYLDLFKKRGQQLANPGDLGLIGMDVKMSDVVDTMELLAGNLPEAEALLQVSPPFRKQSEVYDKMLRIITHLMYLVVKIREARMAERQTKLDRLRMAYHRPLHSSSIGNFNSGLDNDIKAIANIHQQHLDDEAQMEEVRRKIHQFVARTDPRTATGEALLHLALRRSNTLKIRNYGGGLDDEEETEEDDENEEPTSDSPSTFPDAQVVDLMLECGADVHATNLAENTPLHIATLPGNYSQEVVELLLEKGAHIDVKNRVSQKPTDLLKRLSSCKLNSLKYMSLKCLAATAVNAYGLPYEGEVPLELEGFIEKH